MTSKYTTNRSNLFALFLFTLPLMNFISNRISSLANYTFILIIIILTYILNTHNRKFHVSHEIILFINIQIILLLFAVAYKTFAYQYVSINGISVFFFSYIVLLCFILVSTNINLIVDRYFLAVVNFILILSFIAIALGYIVLHTALPDTWQLVYRYDMGHAYTGRPFGLFGQPSINSGVILFLYFIRLYLVQIEKTQESIFSTLFYFSLITMSIYFQKSGTGYIGYLILIIMLSAKNKFLLLLLSAFMVFSISNLYFIYQDEISSFSNKISFEYMLVSYNYFYGRIIIPYINDLSLLDFLFGIDDQRGIPIDFGPVYILAKVGFLYAFTFTSFILYLIIKANNRYIVYAFLLLLILSLHYPIVIYPIPSIFYLLLFIYIENNQDKDKLRVGR